uniref:Uncharacterized protein n=1 Tax=Phlebotomus papatasi TaxID=29031 RepID=A0A1B0EZ69_PHLPP
KVSLHALGLFLLLLTHSAADNDANIPENWVEPHAWGSVQKVGGKPREIPREPAIIGGSCPRDEAHLFYTKLVNFLFDRSKLRENPDGDKLTRTLHLHLTPDLLQRLKEAKTAREIDSVVFEVIEMSREGKIEQVKEIVISVADVITFYLKEIQNSDTLLFFALIVVTLTFVWCVSRRFKRNIVLVFILTIVLISYFLTYLDCNKRLEIKKLMELNGQNEKNPCEVNKSYFYFFSYKFSKDDCFEHLMKTYGPQRSICAPTEVFLQFFSHLAMTQFITLVQESNTVLKDIFMNYSWTERLLVLSFVVGLCYVIVLPVFTTILQYSLPTVIRSINEHGEGENPRQNSRNPPAIQDSDHLVLSGESVQRLLTILTQNASVTVRDAENVLQAEIGNRIEELSEPENTQEGAKKETLAEIELKTEKSDDCDATNTQN